MKAYTVQSVGEPMGALIEVAAPNAFHATAKAAGCVVEAVCLPIWRAERWRAQRYGVECYMPLDNSGRQWLVREKMIMSTAEQGSPEWRQARAGLLTASRFGEALGLRPARLKYARDLVFERLAGAPKHEVNSRSLTWGREIEDFAVEAFELQTGLIAQRCGLIVHPRYPFIAGSPDRLTSDGGGLECKSPHDEAVQVATWLDGMPAEHMPQVQGGMFVTGRPHWYFVSYDPRQAERLRLYVERIPRDDGYIATLAGALRTFETEVCLMLADIESKASTPNHQGAA